MRWLALTALATLTGCEHLPQELPGTALRHFCAFHQHEISSVLTTEAQRQAGVVVCSAVGMRLGTGEVP